MTNGYARPSTPPDAASDEVVTLAAAPLRAAPGDRVAGAYELIEHYGAGPLGDTYRAEGPSGDEVALKIVAHELVPTALERAKMVAGLEPLRQAPRVAQLALLTDAGEADDKVFVVSPWANGRSLRRVLAAYRDAGKVMPPAEVLGVLEGVISALKVLHVRAAHGALYPESVQLTADGLVVLTDAGLAAAVKRGRVVDHFERFPDVMPYLSSDVRGGKPPSAGSDLYALGALASELLTGDPGAGAMGIAGPMLPGYPPSVPAALAQLASLTAAERASALPALLAGLQQHIAERAMPSHRLPQRQGRTELMPAVPVAGGAKKRPTRPG